MSAPIDVLAMLDALCERAASGDPGEYREVSSLRDVVAELIEADDEFDAARLWLRVESADGPPIEVEDLKRAKARYWDAARRRSAALARVKGGAA